MNSEFFVAEFASIQALSVSKWDKIRGWPGAEILDGTSKGGVGASVRHWDGYASELSICADSQSSKKARREITKMRDLLNGWHRKSACGFLMLAIIVTGVWLRSQCFYDVVYFTMGKRSHYLTSCNGIFNWRSWDGKVVKQSFWESRSSLTDQEKLGMRSLEFFRARAAARREAASAWTVPYWGIVAVFSLSSMLLLCRRQVSTRPCNQIRKEQQSVQSVFCS